MYCLITGLTAAIDGFSAANWQAVALQIGLTASGPECQLRWKNHLKPSLSSGLKSCLYLCKEWTSDETAKLLNLAGKHHARQVSL